MKLGRFRFLFIRPRYWRMYFADSGYVAFRVYGRGWLARVLCFAVIRDR